MQKRLMVIGLSSLVTIGLGGCKQTEYVNNTKSTPSEATGPQTQVPVDQLPQDVVKTVHDHVVSPIIFDAASIMWGGHRAYKVYVRSQNTIFIVKVRPDGLFMDMKEYD